MLTRATSHRACSAEKGLPSWPVSNLSWSSPLTVIPRVPGPLGPGVGQFATTATMANVHAFLEEVRHCLLCPSNRAIRG